MLYNPFMPSESNLERLLRPPDFEIRCNGFIEEVNQKIVPKYPDIGIDVTSTSDVLDQETKVREFLASKGKKFRSRYFKLADQLSAYENWASVAIWGWEGPPAVSQILDILPQIDEIASRYGGVKDYSDLEGDLKYPELTSAYIIYVFE